MTGRLLLTMEREWPWGLVLLADPDSRESLPVELDEHGVTVGVTAIRVGILHGIDGAAHAEVWFESNREGLICIHDGSITTDSGNVSLSDAIAEEAVTAVVGRGSRRVRVLVDNTRFPELVVFDLGPLSP